MTNEPVTRVTNAAIFNSRTAEVRLPRGDPRCLIFYSNCARARAHGLRFMMRLRRTKGIPIRPARLWKKCLSLPAVRECSYFSDFFYGLCFFFPSWTLFAKKALVCRTSGTFFIHGGVYNEGIEFQRIHKKWSRVNHFSRGRNFFC